MDHSILFFPIVAGDVIIFGGPARDLIHALLRVFPGTAPEAAWQWRMNSVWFCFELRGKGTKTHGRPLKMNEMMEIATRGSKPKLSQNRMHCSVVSIQCLLSGFIMHCHTPLQSSNFHLSLPATHLQLKHCPYLYYMYIYIYFLHMHIYIHIINIYIYT